ncbi:hypothetical protein BGZ94_001764, partial [Podila epigama]
MTTLRKRFEQQWPRYVVGSTAAWDLFVGLGLLWLGLTVDSLTSAFPGMFAGSELGPEEEDRLMKMIILTAGSMISIFGLIG